MASYADILRAQEAEDRQSGEEVGAGVILDKRAFIPQKAGFMDSWNPLVKNKSDANGNKINSDYDVNDSSSQDAIKKMTELVTSGYNPKAKERLYAYSKIVNGKKIIKIGKTSMKDVWARYEGTGTLNDATILFDIPTDNASEAEAYYHGAKGISEDALAKFGRGKYAQEPLSEAAYMDDLGENNVAAIKRLGILNRGMDKLSPEGQEKLKAITSTNEGFQTLLDGALDEDAQKTLHSKPVKDMSMQELEKVTRLDNPFSPTGVYKLDDLIQNKEFRMASNKMNALFGEGKLRRFGDSEDDYKQRIKDLYSNESVGIDEILGTMMDEEKMTKEEARSIEQAIAIYRATDLTFEQFVDGTQTTLSDPTTYITGGIGGLIGKTVGKLAAKSAVRSISHPLSVKMAAGLAGNVSDASIASFTQTYAEQAKQIAAGNQTDIKWKEVAIGTAIGVVAGGGMIGAVAGIKASSKYSGLTRSTKKALNKLDLAITGKLQIAEDELLKLISKVDKSTKGEFQKQADEISMTIEQKIIAAEKTERADVKSAGTPKEQMDERTAKAKNLFVLHPEVGLKPDKRTTSGSRIAGQKKKDMEPVSDSFIHQKVSNRKGSGVDAVSNNNSAIRAQVEQVDISNPKEKIEAAMKSQRQQLEHPEARAKHGLDTPVKIEMEMARLEKAMINSIPREQWNTLTAIEKKAMKARLKRADIVIKGSIEPEVMKKAFRDDNSEMLTPRMTPERARDHIDEVGEIVRHAKNETKKGKKFNYGGDREMNEPTIPIKSQVMDRLHEGEAKERELMTFALEHVPDNWDGDVHSLPSKSFKSFGDRTFLEGQAQRRAELSSKQVTDVELQNMEARRAMADIRAELDGVDTPEAKREVIAKYHKIMEDIGIKKDDLPSDIDIKEYSESKVKRQRTAKEEKAFQAQMKKTRDIASKTIAKKRKGTERTTGQKEYASGHAMQDDLPYMAKHYGVPNKVVEDLLNPEGCTSMHEYYRTVEQGKKDLMEIVGQAQLDKLGMGNYMNALAPGVRYFRSNVYDTSGSNVQIAGAMLGDIDTITSMKFERKDADVREKIAEGMIDNIPFFKENASKLADGEKQPIRAFMKDRVKDILTPLLYGMGDKSGIKAMMGDPLWGKPDEATATKMYNDMLDEIRKELPEVMRLRDYVAKVVEAGQIKKGKYTIELFDGSKLKVDFTKTTEGTVTVGGKEIKVELLNDSPSEFARVLLVAIIQSGDSIIAKRWTEAGFMHVFDAAHTKSKAELKAIRKIYVDTLAEMYEKDVLGSFFKQLGVNQMDLKKVSETQKAADLKRIREAKEPLALEHGKGSRVETKLTKLPDSYLLSEDNMILHALTANDPKGVTGDYLTRMYVMEHEYTPLWNNDGEGSLMRQIVRAAAQGKGLNHDLLNIDYGTLKSSTNVSVERVKALLDKTYMEARAKLERLPNAGERVKGKRIFIGSDGKYLQGALKGKYPIFKARQADMQRRLNNYWSSSATEKASILGITDNPSGSIPKVTKTEVTQTLERLHSNIDNSAEGSVPAETLSWGQSVIERSRILLGDIGNGLKLANKWSDTEKEFERLNSGFTAKIAGVESDSAIIHQTLKAGFKKDGVEDKDFFRNIVQTGYINIMGVTREQFEKQISGIPSEFKRVVEPYVNQMAKGLGDQSEHYGFYRNSGLEVAREVGIHPDHIQEYATLVELMVVHKSMDQKAWTWVNENKSKSSVKQAMKLMKVNESLSDKLFVNNKEKKIFGYVKETYANNKIATNKAQEHGIVPSNLMANKEGSLQQIRRWDKEQNVHPADVSKWAEKHRMKITEDGFRAIADKEFRDARGRESSGIESIVETYRTIRDKTVAIQQQNKIIEEMSNDSKLFSTKPKEGMRKLTKDETYKLIPALRDKVKFVHKEYADYILGREEAFAVSDKDKMVWGRFVQLAIKDASQKMKYNSVITNISSLKNVAAMAMMVPLASGAKIHKLPGQYKQALTEMRTLLRLKRLRAKAVLTAKQGRIDSLNRRILDLEITKYISAGLSLSDVDGVKTGLGILDHIAKRSITDRGYNGLKELLLAPNSVGGKILIDFVTTQDGIGRYLTAKTLVDQGKDIHTAVRQSNSAYADMRILSPRLISALDNHGVMPFLGFVTKMVPGTARLMWDHKLSATAVTVGLYATMHATDSMSSGINPGQQAIDEPEKIIRGTADVLETPARLIKGLVPRSYTSWYSKVDRLGFYKGTARTVFPEELHKPRNPNKPDYRGTTQKVVESFK